MLKFIILIFFILIIKISINKYLFYKNTKVYLINLNYRKDRLEIFKNTYNFHNIDYEVIPAIDGNNLDINRLYKQQILGEYCMNTMNKNIRDFHYEINTKGAIGCYLSHIEVWKKIKENKNCNYGIIFEDDIDINNNITEKVIYNYISNLPNDWDILLLNKNRVVMTREKNNLFKVSKFICTHSYIIKRSSIDKILKKILPINQQIDFKLSCLAKNGKINVYLYNDINNKKFYKQYYSSTDIQSDTDENASWLLNCSI